MKKELNLFILWENARYTEEKILKDISCRFEILKTFNVKWSEEQFAYNLSRLYGKKLAKVNRKKELCGSGEFLLIVVYDNNPKHVDGKNINMASAKNIYRRWTNGGHLIHASDHLAETDENLMFLLGMNSDEFIEKHTDREWNKNHISISQEVVGAPEWKTEQDMLEMVQKLPETSVRRIQDTHLITTNDVSRVCRLLNATKRLFFMKRNLYQVPVNGENKYVYIRRTV